MRRRRRRPRFAIAGLLLAALAGCGERTSPPAKPTAPPAVDRRDEPPPRADAAPNVRVLASTDAGDDVVIREAPPIPKPEPPDERTRPSAKHVWTQGWWAWDGAHYDWTPGRWQIPPEGTTEWVPAEYVTRGDGYVFVPGRWR